MQDENIDPKKTVKNKVYVFLRLLTKTYQMNRLKKKNSMQRWEVASYKF